MHPILERQLKRIFGEQVPIAAQWRAFLQLVSDTYTHLDEDRALLNRSLDLSSKEFLENHRRLEETRIKVEKQAQNLAREVTARTKELQLRIAELEDVRKATTNLLEDLEEKRKALSEAKATDDAIFASIGNGLIITDNKGNIVQVNENFEKLLGWTAKEVIGKNMVDVVQKVDEYGEIIPPNKRSVYRVLTGELPAGRVSTILKTHSYIRKDKSKFPIVGVVTPVIVNNQIIGAVQVFRDVTYEREVDRAKTEFVSLASHQLRTPLTSINWYVEMLTSGDAGALNDKQKELLSEVYSASRRMVRLVNDLLNVSRLETGQLKVEPVPTDLIAFIPKISKELDPLVAETGCRISYQFPEKSVGMVNIDTAVLEQVIENLLTNAIRYSSLDKKGMVTVSLAVRPEGYTIEISDNGIGIPKDAQGRIFERFFRADNARTVMPEGSGMGLYLVKKMLESTGGTIRFTSDPGKGTAFYVTIPLSGMVAKEGEKGLAL